MQNSDTNLAHAKKVAQRWMAYSMPYLNTRKLTNGVYFYELLQDGSKLKGGKFIIQH